jgi:tetratricopeptide (TPR) repeat protein
VDKSKGDSTVLPEEIERRVGSALIRSRRIKLITVALVLGWACVGLVVGLHLYREQRTRVAEQEKLTAQLKKNEETAAQLKTQAENARLATTFVASGAFKANHGDWNGALADYNKALFYDASNPAALSYGGYLKLRMGQTQEAEQMLGKAVELDPNQAWDRYNYALALWASGKHAEAVSQVQAVLKLDPAFKSTIAGDPQFRKFRTDPTFKELIQP